MAMSALIDQANATRSLDDGRERASRLRDDEPRAQAEPL
jgi:hypothetical protein